MLGSNRSRLDAAGGEAALVRDPGRDHPVASFAAVGRNGHQLHPAGRETRVLHHETNRCDGGSNELRMDAGSTLCALLRRSPRLDSAMEACSGAHSYGRKAHRSNLHRLSHEERGARPW